MGETPLRDVTLPDGGLRFRYLKAGYITREFDRKFPEFLDHEGTVWMRKDFGVPPEMVLVTGVTASSWNGLPADLDDFLIDRYEVTNKQFFQFVEAGGYEEPKFWEHLKSERDGRALSWEEARREFCDRSGNFGPALWSHGSFPKGSEDYPVRGISWFEASAYARFAGKELPTIYHWQWAADGNASHMVALGNYSGEGPAPIGTYSGIGRFDVYDLAGNVKEWCQNSDFRGNRCLRGAAWNEAEYRFLNVDVASPWDRSETHGFRCVRYLGESKPPAETLEQWTLEMPHLANLNRWPLETLLPWFRYDTDIPLNVQAVEVEQRPSSPYRRETVRLDAAYGGENFEVHCFIPRQMKSTYETVLFMPGAGSWMAKKFIPGDIMEWEVVPELVNSGRMVCMPVCKGMYERGSGQMMTPSIQTRDLWVAAIKDILRTVEYLVTRDDVDRNRIVYFGYSSSSVLGPAVLATEEGFGAAILVSGGYPSEQSMPGRMILNPFHFAPHVRLPVLMINGSFDTYFDYQRMQLPFFRDLGSERKEHVVLKSGHNPPTDEIMKATESWLNEIVGPAS